MSKIKGAICLSRVTSNTEGDFIRVTINDRDAGIQFLSAKMTLADFTLLITGMAYIEAEIDVLGIENVGKKLEVDKIEFPLGDQFSSIPYDDRKDYASATAMQYTPEGWVNDKYFGARKSFFKKGGEDWAMCTIRRWV